MGKPIVGFQTSNGSVYSFDEETGVSQRLKVSRGAGQGALHAEAYCVFIDKKDLNARDGIGPAVVYSQHCYKQGEANFSTPLKLCNKVNGQVQFYDMDEKPVLDAANQNYTAVAFRFRDGADALYQEVELRPHAGLIPMEFYCDRDDEDQRNLGPHFGHQVTETFETVDELKTALQSAKSDIAAQGIQTRSKSEHRSECNPIVGTDTTEDQANKWFHNRSRKPVSTPTADQKPEAGTLKDATKSFDPDNERQLELQKRIAHMQARRAFHEEHEPTRGRGRHPS